MILYCSNYRDYADVYLYFRSYLGNFFNEQTGAPDTARFRLVDMFMSRHEVILMESIVDHLQKSPHYVLLLLVLKG